MGSDIYTQSIDRHQMFQSTLPHGERRQIAIFDLEKKEVSIHAPTWGATTGLNKVIKYVEVSIHAPTWGATSNYIQVTAMGEFQSTLPHGERRREIDTKKQRLCFNPRSHMGSDSTITPSLTPRTVSIHAPTWGATISRCADATAI